MTPAPPTLTLHCPVSLSSAITEAEGAARIQDIWVGQAVGSWCHHVSSRGMHSMFLMSCSYREASRKPEPMCKGRPQGDKRGGGHHQRDFCPLHRKPHFSVLKRLAGLSVIYPLVNGRQTLSCWPGRIPWAESPVLETWVKSNKVDRSVRMEALISPSVSKGDSST